MFKVLVFAYDNLKIDCLGRIFSPSQYKEGRATVTTVAHALRPDHDPDRPGRHRPQRPQAASTPARVDRDPARVDPNWQLLKLLRVTVTGPCQ